MAHTVLIVDDSPTSGPELKAVLEREGYHVLLALGAQEALDLLTAAHVDLIITEAILPGLNGFDLVRRVRREHAEIPIVMLSIASAPEDYATAFEAGADEYFLKPPEAPKIIAATRGLIAKYEVAHANGHRSARGAALVRRHGSRGRIITAFSLKGGVGTSTIAVNVAVAIKQLAPSSRVGLIDLSLEHGSDALMLDIVPTSTIADWAREDMDRANANLLYEYFVPHRSGISVLSAPTSPEQAETVRPDIVRKIVQLAPDVFDYVVLDTASSFTENSLIALEAAHHILFPLSPDLAALRATVNAMRILQAVNIDAERIQLIVNNPILAAGLSRQQIEGSLNRPVTILPNGGPNLVDAINQGVPAVMLGEGEPIIQALVDLARTVCEPEVSEIPSRNRSLLNRLRVPLARGGR